MPRREKAPRGAPCWIDLFTSDPEASQAFYGGLFGWTSESAGEEYGGYINFRFDDVPVAGAMANDGSSGAPDAWSVYLASGDAAATVDAAAAHGGLVVVPPADVGELGRMAVLADAGGAVIGVWQPGLHTGFGVIDEPGAPAWFELHTRDLPASVTFYRDVFGWDIEVASDTPELRYVVMKEGDDQLAGIMDASSFLPEGIPAHWSVYFRVADVDAALARAVELGGTITMPAEETPYGRLAQVSDPTGAPFRLVGS